MGWLKTVGIVVLVLVILIGLFVFSVSNRLGNGLRMELAAMKAKGDPTTIEALLGPPVPDSENAAVLYDQAIALLPAGGYTSPDEEALEDGLSTQKLDSDPLVLKRAEDVIGRNKDLFSLLDRATSMPECRFAIDWRGLFTLFPQFAKIREFERMCCAKALVNAKEGNMDEAVHSLNTGFKLEKSLSEMPTLTGPLVRIACNAIASKELQEMLSYHDINEQQAKLLFDTLAAIDRSAGFTVALEGEKINVMKEWPEIIREGASGVYESSNSGSSSSPFQTLQSGATDLAYKTVLWPGDEAVYLTALDRQIAGVKLTYKEAKSSGVLDDYQSFPSYALISKLLAPVDGKAQWKRIIFSCQVSGDQVFLAIMSYKSRFGTYPRTFADLKTKLGWDLPKDLFSEKDFLYKPLPKGFLLYSVGPNMKDDGGVQHEQGGFYSTETGDFVWKWDK